MDSGSSFDSPKFLGVCRLNRKNSIQGIWKHGYKECWGADTPRISEHFSIDSWFERFRFPLHISDTSQRYLFKVGFSQKGKPAKRIGCPIII